MPSDKLIIEATEVESDYRTLLGLMTDVGAVLENHTLTKEEDWLYYSESIFTKFYYHFATTFFLANQGTNIENVGHKKIKVHFLDFPSIISLSRSALETYILFAWIFKNPAGKETGKLFHLAWEIHGLLERQKYVPMVEDSKHKLQLEKTQIAELKNRLKLSSVFQSLTTGQQTMLSNGDWRFSQSYPILAGQIGLGCNHIENIYRFFSLYSHTQSISIYQIRETISPDKRMELMLPFLKVNLMIASKMIKDYSQLFESTRKKYMEMAFSTLTVDHWTDLEESLENSLKAITVK